ncbi:MAG: hypothetical protein KJ804_13095 [Proteobacteria bacterium]|nr:hypothetical protein [Pseudomonadota bacterium]MBU1059243.1 hypothetical protein [Pseudomonadota bacterium]
MFAKSRYQNFPFPFPASGNSADQLKLFAKDQGIPRSCFNATFPVTVFNFIRDQLSVLSPELWRNSERADELVGVSEAKHYNLIITTTSQNLA